MAVLAGDYGGYNAIANRQAALQRYTPPQPATSAQVRPTTTRGTISSGPSGRYSSSSGGGGRPMAPPAAAPGPIDPNAWLGADTSYQDQLRQLQLALSNFNADVTRRQGEIGTDYDTSNRAMGRQKELDLEAMEADWAGRGMIRSGLYGEAVGNYNEEFNQRLAELLSGRDRALSSLTQEQNSFQAQQALDQQAAREAALRRRAAGLGTI